MMGGRMKLMTIQTHITYNLCLVILNVHGTTPQLALGYIIKF